MDDENLSSKLEAEQMANQGLTNKLHRDSSKF